ncbi:hypothetical protein LV779_00425 [Streptomyces thinghirensis]|nr:hypothetical protein [Streptomyces thinghirensis]
MSPGVGRPRTAVPPSRPCSASMRRIVALPLRLAHADGTPAAGNAGRRSGPRSSSTSAAALGGPGRPGRRRRARGGGTGPHLTLLRRRRDGP